MNAKTVKIYSSLLAVTGALGLMAGAVWGFVMLLVGLFGFVVGRFME